MQLLRIHIDFEIYLFFWIKEAFSWDKKATSTGKTDWDLFLACMLLPANRSVDRPCFYYGYIKINGHLYAMVELLPYKVQIQVYGPKFHYQCFLFSSASALPMFLFISLVVMHSSFKIWPHAFSQGKPFASQFFLHLCLFLILLPFFTREGIYFIPFRFNGKLEACKPFIELRWMCGELGKYKFRNVLILD